jgi:hypothetical protein
MRMNFVETGSAGVEWSQLAQDRDWWRALVNTMTNLHVLATRI